MCNKTGAHGGLLQKRQLEFSFRNTRESFLLAEKNLDPLERQCADPNGRAV